MNDETWRRGESDEEAPADHVADDEVWRRDEIESPCTKICLIHPEAEICTGCYRTRDEIAGWSQMAPAERRRIMLELASRKGRLHRRRGGRAARLGRGTDG